MKIKHVLLAFAALIVAVVVGGYIYLSTLDFETLKAEVAAEVEKATGRQLTISGPVDLAIGLQPAIAVEDVTLANADWGSRPEMITLDRFELEVELLPLISGDVQVNRVVLVRPDILLETNPAGDGNWALGPATAEATGEATGEAAGDETAQPGAPGAGGMIPQIVALAIEEGQLVYRDGASGETMTLGLESLTLRQAGAGQELDLAATFQEAEIALSGTIGAPEAVLADRDLPIDLAGSVAGNEVAVNGVVKTPLSAPTPELSLTLSGDSLASFAPLAGGAAIPDFGPYSLEGRLVAEGPRYGVEGLKAEIGESDLSGSLSADLSGARPQVTADLTAAVIDLRDFQAESGEAAEDSAEGESADGGGGAGESPYVIPDTPLPLDGLRAADATVQLKAGVLRVDPELEISDITLGLTLANGNLEVAPLQAGYQQSRLDGQVALDASGDTPRLATNLAIDELDFGRMLNEQGITDEVEGTMDIRIDLTGAGASPRAIASSLNGTTELVNEGGKISNKLLAILGADFSQILGPLLGESDTTALNCIVSRFDVADGLAESRAMVLDTATFSLAGAGNVDLRSEELDLTFDTSSRVPALVSLAIPFRVQGTMKNPRVLPDPAGALKGLAGAAAGISNPLAVLGGLAGGAASDGGGESQDGGSENLCLTALDPDAQAAAGAEPTDSAPAMPESVEDVGKAVEEMVPEGGAEDAGKAVEEGVEKLKGLFGE